MLKLVCKYQHQEAEIHLNGRWLKLNPREWRHQFDVIVNVGLGTNDTNQKQVQIGNLLAMQEKLAGLGLVGPKEAFNGGAEMVKTLGYKDVTRFLKSPPDQPPPSQPPLPLQIEQMKLQAAGQHKQLDVQAQMQLEQVKGQATIQIEQAKLQMQGQIEQAKMQAQMQVDVNRQSAEAEQLQLKAQQDAQLEQMRNQLANEHKTAELNHAMVLEQMKIQAAKEKSELEASVKIQVAQISAQNTLDTASMAAQRAAANEITTEIGSDADDPVMAGITQLAQSMAAIQNHISAPRKVVRGTDGRAVGVDIGGIVKPINRGQDGRMESI
jgi:hypothetical protein